MLFKEWERQALQRAATLRADKSAEKSKVRSVVRIACQEPGKNANGARVTKIVLVSKDPIGGFGCLP